MSEAVLIAVIVALGPVLVAIVGLQVQSKRKVEQVHLLVNDRLDKVLKANELLVVANRELIGTVADLRHHIVMDSATQLSAAEERAIGKAGQVPPLSQTLQSTTIQDPAKDLSEIDEPTTP